jgi:hypothetical protein
MRKLIPSMVSVQALFLDFSHAGIGTPFPSPQPNKKQLHHRGPLHHSLSRSSGRRRDRLGLEDGLQEVLDHLLPVLLAKLLDLLDLDLGLLVGLLLGLLVALSVLEAGKYMSASLCQEGARTKKKQKKNAPWPQTP